MYGVSIWKIKCIPPHDTLELAWKNNLDTENTGFTFYGNFNIKKKKSKFQESYDQKKFRMIKIIILAMYYTTP